METQDLAEQSALVATADANAVTDAPEATAADGEVETKQAEPAKTFTQAEVDALVQKRLLKEERRVHRRVEQQLREEAQRSAQAVPPKREAFQDDEAYATAQVEHLVQQRAEKLAAERERQREVAQRHESFQSKAEAVAERFPDFDEVVTNPTLRINEAMAEYISDSDIGPELAYHLGKNPSKAASISALSPIKAARELARIESELASKPKPKASNAPEPITPVGVRGKATASNAPSDDDDMDTWMRKERARVASRQ
jgi:hypothetical protein